MPLAMPEDVTAIAATLSAPRIGRYLTATGGDAVRAMVLYGWNARISAALMLPAHFAEVSTRNAVDAALSAVYGPQWPWDVSFEKSLPDKRGPFYTPRGDLVHVRGKEPTTGKVIAELKFVFWQNLFTSRHDTRIWKHQIEQLFPNATGAPQEVRGRIYDDLEAIRRLRNRIAHHEPIFTRDLRDDLERMLELVHIRSEATASWVRAMEDATDVLAQRP